MERGPSRISGALAKLGMLAYPFLVYFGLSYFEPRYVGLALFLVVVTQFFQRGAFQSDTRSVRIMPVVFVGMISALLVSTLNDVLFLRLYPFFVNMAFLFVFSISLLKPPSVIERIARITNPTLSEQALVYTRNLTKVWCVFFVVNGGVSLYTALFASIGTWTLYNGFVAYIAMGALILIDLSIRTVKRNNG